MYGMVNKAMNEMVVGAHGSAVWQEICDEAQLDTASFVSMRQYPDEITYNLVGAASKVLETPASILLDAFGYYWISFAKKHYEELFAFAGTDLVAFLSQLDQMHERMSRTFPDYRPPSFRCEKDGDSESVLLHYYSEREGLSPFVLGLVRGLAELHCDTKVGVELVSEEGANRVFKIRFI